MSATGQGPHGSAAGVYQGFIDAVNRQDLEEAARFVDGARYRENCVGFTRGFVDWEAAKKSVRQVWKGLPDLRVELDQVLASGDVALAHGTVRGTATGRLYGAPATRRSFQASSARNSVTGTLTATWSTVAVTVGDRSPCAPALRDHAAE